MVVAVPTEDNADRISAFNTRRLIPPECARCSSIVSIDCIHLSFQANTNAHGDNLRSGVFHQVDAFHSPRVTHANFATESPGGESSPEVFGASAAGHDKALILKAHSILPWHELGAAAVP